MIFQYHILFFVSFALLITGCRPSTLEEYREEGGEIVIEIIKELKAAHTREELLIASPRLKHLFDDLIDLMIAAQKFHEQHSELDLSEPNSRTLFLSHRLRKEIERLYRIDGCREIIEKSQEEALFRLDAFEKKQLANKETFFKQMGKEP